MDDVELVGAPPHSQAARRLNVSGSGNLPRAIMAYSSTSIRSRNSRQSGVRNGSGCRYRSRLGTRVSTTSASSSGYGWPENTSTS